MPLLLRHHSFRNNTKFYEKLIFLTPWYTRVRIRGYEMLTFRKFHGCAIWIHLTRKVVSYISSDLISVVYKKLIWLTHDHDTYCNNYKTQLNFKVCMFKSAIKAKKPNCLTQFRALPNELWLRIMLNSFMTEVVLI